MIEIQQKNMGRIAPLFQGMEDTLIQCCFEGTMGRAWADDAENPACAMLYAGDFGFLAGDATHKNAAQAAAFVPAGMRQSHMAMICQNAQWEALVEQAHGGRITKRTRWHFPLDCTFDAATLQGYIDALPAAYRPRPVDAHIYEDACDNTFDSPADFLAHGLGFYIPGDNPGETACCAASYAYTSTAIEVDIYTLEAYRRRGFALACCAALILACRTRGLYPTWDAANETSVALAHKLGYDRERTYTSYVIEFAPDKG